jgi:uncharacterized protein (TIGR02611 family)
VSRDQPDPGPKGGADPGQTGTSVPRATDDPTDDTLRQHLREASAAAYRKVESSAPPSVAARMVAFRERIRARRALDTAWRMMVFTLGVTLVALGLLMMVLPGPGWGALILGLVVLASEFTWATRVLDPVKEAAHRAKEAALDPRRRRRNLIIGGIAGVAVAVFLIWYLATYGLTLGPILDVLTAVKDWFLGLF